MQGDKDQFYLLIQQNCKFWSKFGYSDSAILYHHETLHTACCMWKMLKIIDFSWLKCPPFIKIVSVLNMMDEVSMIFGQLAIVTRLFAQFYAGT